MAGYYGTLEMCIPGPTVDDCIQELCTTGLYDRRLDHSGSGRWDSDYYGLVKNTGTGAEAERCLKLHAGWLLMDCCNGTRYCWQQHSDYVLPGLL